MKKTVLITGAASGIGKQTALFFAEKGWTVIATMLSLAEAEELLNDPTIFCYELDVTSTESIVIAQQKILQNHKKIDVIINNAGVGYRSFVELSEDEKEIIRALLEEHEILRNPETQFDMIGKSIENIFIKLLV